MGDEAVDGLFDGEAELETFDVLDEELFVEGLGVVEVEGGTFGFGDVGAVDVVVVEGEGESVVAEVARQAAGELGLAGTGDTGDADEEVVHHSIVRQKWLGALGYCLRRRVRADSGRIFQLLLGVTGNDFFFV